MRRSLRSGSSLCALGLLLAGLLCACGGKTRAPASPAPPAYRGQVPVLARAAPVAMLPADTWLVIAGASPRAVAAELRWPEVLQGHGALHAQLASVATAVAGADVLDPDNLDEIGLDPAGAFGVALLGGDEAAAAIFAGVSDRARLQAFLDRILAPGMGKLEPRAMGQATVLFPAGEAEVAIVLRDRAFFLLVLDRAEDREPLARAVATIPRERSLAAEPAFVAAMKRLDYGAAAAGYVAMHELAGRAERAADRNAENVQGYFQEMIGATESQLATAEAGGDAEAAARLREHLAEQKTWQAQSQAATAGSRKIFADLLAPLGGVGLGLGIDGPALRVRVSVQPRAGSLPARLLRHGGASLAILRALDEVPVLALGGHSEPAAVLELVDLLRAMGDGGLEPARQALRALGLDLDEDILPVLDGEIAIAVTADRAQLATGGAMREDMVGVCVIAGLSDPARARQILDRLAGHPALASMIEDRPAGRGLVVPVWGTHRLHIDVAGQHLVASTDPGDAARVAANGASFATALPGEAQALLGAQPWDGMFLLDVAGALGITWIGPVPSPPPVPVDAPATEQGQALQKELGEIDAEIQELQPEIESSMRERALATTQPLGTTLLVAHAGADGVAMFGGQLTTAAHVSDAVLVWILGWLELSGAGDLAPDPALTEQKTRLQKLHERRWEIIQALESLSAAPEPPAAPTPEPAAPAKPAPAQPKKRPRK
jgi:hypothetical protein